MHQHCPSHFVANIEIEFINESTQYARSAEVRDDDESDFGPFSVSPLPSDPFGAWVDVTHALSYSGAHIHGVPGVQVYAEADWPDNQWAMAEAYGSYRIDFTALESGLLEMELDYVYRMVLRTENPYEDAWASFDVWASLSGETDAVTHTDPVDEPWLGHLTLSKQFEEGDSGYLHVIFGADATAVSPVPEPSTILLLGSGLLGLVGFGRKLKN